MAYPVSANFRSYIAKTHQVVVQADICSPDGTVLLSPNPVNGMVTVDVDRDIRRDAGNLDLVDPTNTLTPLTASALLSPLSGNELRLYRGVQYSDGTIEQVPLGVFTWNSVDVVDSGQGITITLGTLQDRASDVTSTRYPAPIVVTTATAIETVIANIVSSVYPGVSYANGALPATGSTISNVAYGVENDASPWQDARALADQFGWRLYFDVNGQLAMSSITAANLTSPIATYSSSNLVMTAMTRSWDILDTYNGVIAVGEGSGLLFPARAVAWDDDPSSPTYYLGPFGRRPRVYSSPFLLTNDQAQAAANQQLQKTLGVSEQLSWAQLVDPSLDVDDAITITRTSMGVSAIYRIDRLEIPLSPTDAMTATARTRRVIS